MMSGISRSRTSIAAIRSWRICLSAGVVSNVVSCSSSFWIAFDCSMLGFEIIASSICLAASDRYSGFIAYLTM